MQGFAKFLEDGGTLMYFNLGTSIIVLSMIVDRLLFFLVKSSVNARAFLETSASWCSPTTSTAR